MLSLLSVSTVAIKTLPAVTLDDCIVRFVEHICVAQTFVRAEWSATTTPLDKSPSADDVADNEADKCPK